LVSGECAMRQRSSMNRMMAMKKSERGGRVRGGGGGERCGENIVVDRGRDRLSRDTIQGEIVYLPRVDPFSC